jgi:nitrogen fixation NifU-like protein
MSANFYQELILERVRNAHHAGRPAGFDAEGEVSNRLCGDHIHVYLSREGMRLRHDSRGCAIMVASAELMADAVAGADAEQVRRLRAAFAEMVETGEENPALGPLNALREVSEFRSRIRCATLPWSALAQALELEDTE